MSREIDRRDFSINQITPARENELRTRASEVSDQVLPGEHRIAVASFDATTGNPSVIVSESAPAEEGNYIQRALDHMQSISPVMGFAATQPAEFMADPQVPVTSSGARSVYLQQQYKGIPIFQAAQTVRFAPTGALKSSAGTSVTVAQDLPVALNLSVQDAVLRAAEHVAVPDVDEQGTTDQFGEPLTFTTVDLTGFVPQIIAAFSDKANRPTVLAAGPFGDRIKAGLIWFPLDKNNKNLQLAWEIILTMPHDEGQFSTIVDAGDGEILYCHQLLRTVVARGNVFRVDGGSVRQMTDFPRLLADYGIPIPTNLPGGFPDHWVAVDSAVGNCVNAHRGVAGTSFQGLVQNGILTFDPANPFGEDQQVLNIFYYNCYMHDYFYLLGFTEIAGNFQQDNFGRGGLGSDRVDARAHPGPVFGTANMSRSIDGQTSIMNMGLVSSTNRHTALDSSVVFHEFMHGVTNRLVGGPMNDHALDADQSSGMGEGWSDYIACTINNSTTVGAWVINNPAGIRMFPYDSDFPDNFGDLGTGRYNEEHNIGEIWCAILMEINRKIGTQLGVQLVVDALSLSPANPSFLDMRDSIFEAIDDMLAAGRLSSDEHASTKFCLGIVFAKFGMGPGAQSNGATLNGIVADFNGFSFETTNILTIAECCLNKTPPLSLREDIFGVYGNDNPQTRSLKDQLDLIQNTPFVRVALVTIQGATPTLQRDLDNANLVYQNECDAWIYCVDSTTVNRPDLLILNQDDCSGSGHSVSAEEDELFDLGRDLGADIVGYYINSSNGGFAGCAAHPAGRRGFWVGASASPWTFAHELTHVVGDNPHVSDTDNLMFGGGTGNITNLPPDLTDTQCDRIHNDVAMESC